MRSIYILLTKSTTICSKVVYMATRSEFTHAAISLNGNFDELYTFSRKYKRIILPAGFVTESIFDAIRTTWTAPFTKYAQAKAATANSREFSAIWKTTKTNTDTVSWDFLCVILIRNMTAREKCSALNLFIMLSANPEQCAKMPSHVS